MRGRAALLPLALALGACVSPGADRGLSLRPDPQGLGVAGSGGLVISFGRDGPGALAAATRVQGKSPTITGPDTCRVARWRDGLALHFAAGTFSGWSTANSQAGELCPL
ncbi:MAG: hypothetical protein JXJ18_05075 [Rhodobacteraceae bacterium]|nr:hypothetical protein [Paracoccaceae bacterium]